MKKYLLNPHISIFSMLCFSVCLLCGCKKDKDTKPALTSNNPTGPPNYSIDCEKDIAVVGEKLEFRVWAKGYGPDYLWDFGDSTKGGGDLVYHTYKKAGIFLVVMVPNGDSSKIQKKGITIREK